MQFQSNRQPCDMILSEKLAIWHKTFFYLCHLYLLIVFVFSKSLLFM